MHERSPTSFTMPESYLTEVKSKLQLVAGMLPSLGVFSAEEG